VRWRGSFETAVDDVDYGTFEISPDIISRDAQRFDSSCRDPLISPPIPLWIFSEFVRHSIDLDCKPSCLAEEVQNEWTERMLSPELKAIRTQLQYAPKPDFRRAPPFAQLTRQVN
jgi:hypothetical protein